MQMYRTVDLDGKITANDPHGRVIIERVCRWNNNTVNSACPAVRMTVSDLIVGFWTIP